MMISFEAAVELVVEAPGLGADLEHAGVARVVDPQRRLAELLAGVEDLLPAVLGHPTAAQLLAADPGLGGDESLRELGLGHLEREQRHGVSLERRVLGDVGDQRRLAHRGPGGDHDQVAGLEAAGQLVDVLEAGGRPGQRASSRSTAGGACRSPRRGSRRSSGTPSGARPGRPRAPSARRAPAGRGRSIAGQNARLDLVRGRQQRAQPGVVADDPTVVARVAGGRHPARQLVDRLGAADLLELAVLPERLGDRQVVDLAIALVQLDHRREHGAVLLAVEVVGPQAAPRPAAGTGAARPAVPPRAPTSRPRGCAAGRRCSGRRSRSVRV